MATLHPASLNDCASLRSPDCGLVSQHLIGSGLRFTPRPTIPFLSLGAPRGGGGAPWTPRTSYLLRDYVRPP